MARRGQGPLSFWRTIGVVRPKNWMSLVLWTHSFTGGGSGAGAGDGGDSGCSCLCSSDEDAMAMGLVEEIASFDQHHHPFFLERETENFREMRG